MFVIRAILRDKRKWDSVFSWKKDVGFFWKKRGKTYIPPTVDWAFAIFEIIGNCFRLVIHSLNLIEARRYFGADTVTGWGLPRGGNTDLPCRGHHSSKIRMLCHPDARKDLAQGQRIIHQETLRDSSLMLRMTQYNERFAAPKLTKNHSFPFLGCGYR